METATKAYNPKDYWYSRGMKYSVSIDTSGELDFLVKAIEPILDFRRSGHNILEVGSGHGRIYDTMRNSYGLPITEENFTMCDFVDTMRYKCLKNTGILPDAWDGKTLPYKDNSFDLVISFSVALHVPPEDIGLFLSEHIRVSKRYLFLATCIDSAVPLAPHCFIHGNEYAELIKDYVPVRYRAFKYDGATRMAWLFDLSYDKGETNGK